MKREQRSQVAHPEFADLARRILTRRRRQRARRWFGLLLVALTPILGAVAYQRVAPPLGAAAEENDQLAIPETENQATGTEFEVAEIDAIRDPIFLSAPSKQTGSRRYELQFQNVSSAATLTGKVFYVSDRMVSTSAQLATALPATPQDFALLTSASPAEQASVAEENVSTVGSGDLDQSGWSGQDGSADDGADVPGQVASLVGSSTLKLAAPSTRPLGSRELIVKVAGQRSVRAVLEDAGLQDGALDRAALATASLLNTQLLRAGSVAIILLDRPPDKSAAEVLINLTIVDQEGQAGAIRISGDGQSYTVVDDENLAANALAYVDKSTAGQGDTQLRLMDGLYASGVREGVPPTIMSEAVMQLARGYDLAEFLQPEDRFTIIYSDTARDTERDSGFVLYVAIVTRSRTLACYVLKPGIDRDFACMTEKDTVTQQLGLPGFRTPVNGVLSSGFGPRIHPILKQVRTHNGVDWAAPSGTPISAAFDGTIAFVGPNKGFGNFVRIQHAGGIATGYAHMSAFAKGVTIGQQVKAGDLIGYVGTTGLSTGPHLHFELYVDGMPVDPFNFQPTVATASNEKEKLIGRIIHVESGGNANAANPRSSAVGLGQFLAGTWMRMIRSYRPDLANSMSVEALLDLRFDPTVSREMLHHFASENEADLRRAGKNPTAGNLYLAHFLGSGGAISVLRADPSEPISNVVGYQVVSANPFLAGRDAQWVVDWAARKMSGSTTYLRRRLPPEMAIKNSRFAAYSGAIDKLLKAIQQRQSG